MEEMILSPCDGMLEEIVIHHEQEAKRCSTIFKIKKTDGTFLELKKSYIGKVLSVEVKEGDEVVKGMVLAYVEEYAIEI
jgi:acetyl/propionyl-CoA carboxylase alpha subunit